MRNVYAQKGDYYFLNTFISEKTLACHSIHKGTFAFFGWCHTGHGNCELVNDATGHIT